jgi:hypothetical protein
MSEVLEQYVLLFQQPVNLSDLITIVLEILERSNSD